MFNCILNEIGRRASIAMQKRNLRSPNHFLSLIAAIANLQSCPEQEKSGVRLANQTGKSILECAIGRADNRASAR